MGQTDSRDKAFDESPGLLVAAGNLFGIRGSPVFCRAVVKCARLPEACIQMTFE